MFEYVLEDNEMKTYHNIYKKVCQIADENFAMRSTRNLRSNSTDVDFEIHCYKNVFRPFITSVISELSKRFNSHFQKAAKMSNLTSVNIVKCNIDSSSKAASHFHGIHDITIFTTRIDLQHLTDVVSLKIFIQAIKWNNTNFLELPALMDKTLLHAKQNTYPKVRAL